MTEKGQWLKAARKARGWSAATLADEVCKAASERGFDLTVVQQNVSHFENGRHKSVPIWFKWAEALLTGREDYPAATPLSSPILSVTLPIPLGSEEALAQMFEGLLAGLDPNASRASHARLLARKLPIALSSLRDLRTVSETRPDRPSASSEADVDRATANHELQR
ncbi:helix-turn-helix transcriptional regulator [uncultured Sphingomonas sp.]|uniref:helix-turn-helix transcriptional regulator n=1 Tax=uncultured Sphingomonas sp. TaxID=158754 RepID=UPI0037483190